MPSSGAVNVADVEVVPTSQFTHPDPALYWTVYVAMSVTPVSGAHVTVKDIEFLYCGRAFTWEPGVRVSIMVHVPRTVPEGVGRVRYATLGDIVFRGVRSDVDPVGHEDPRLVPGRGRPVPDVHAVILDDDPSPGHRRESVGPKRLDIKEVLDGQVAGRHDRGPRERCVHGDGPAVIVHEELVITDEREARVVDGEATREGRVADEVESDAVGALDRRAVARRALNDACDGVEGGTPIGHQGSDDTGRVAPASAVRTGGIPAAASLESQDRVRSEGRSRKDHADSRGAAPVAPCRPPVPSLSPRQRADPVVRDRSRVEKPVIFSERDHSRRFPSLPSDVPAASAKPSGQTVDRVRVDRGRTKD